MKKFNFSIGHIMAWICIAFIFSVKANAQCTIKSKLFGCVGVPESFEVSGVNVSTADSIVWTFSNGKSKGTPVTNVWSTPTVGNTVVTVTVYKGGAAACSTTTSIIIYANPIADFHLLSPNPQCFNGNKFKYENLSTNPSGNDIERTDFFWGDGAVQTDSLPKGIPNIFGPHTMVVASSGGKYTPALKVVDSKGCISYIEKTALIEIRPDLGVDFSTPVPSNCYSTSVNLTNTSTIKQPDVKNFVWDFGDGSPLDSTNWSPKHTYTGDGCFTATLIIQSNDKCYDTMIKKAACNINPKLDVTVQNGDVQCAGNQNFIFNHPPIQGATFLWNFDDPPTGFLNVDNRNWQTTHQFSSPGPYNVRFSLSIKGCPFSTVYPVHVKGPGAAIEKKPSSIIAPSQRYQCKITDTVFFTNNSTYYLNDDSAFNDFYYSTSAGTLFQFIDAKTLHVDFDTIPLQTGVAKSLTTHTGQTVYVSANADTLIINSSVFVFSGKFLKSGGARLTRDGFNNNGKQADRLWDFADNQAPKCTTDSRPIYPIDAKYGNTHMAGPLAPAWTYDANGKWYNCNFNKDSLPKHWYTPGFEQCYAVRLILKDTSQKDPNIRAITSSQNDPALPDSACESTNTVNLALTGPNASGLRWQGIPCYGPANVYGFTFDFSNTGPSCDRQMFWVHMDSLADRVDNDPDIFTKWIPQNGTVVDRNFTPWTATTSNLPPNVGSIFWQYQPNGGYPTSVADKAGWVTIGLRIQNGIDPITGQPCIDEKWYHNVYRYIKSNPAFKFYDEVKDSSYTFERSCAPKEVTVKRDSTYFLKNNTYTYASDSIGVEIWNWGDGEVEIDSFYRYENRGNKYYSYIKRFTISALGAVTQTDSIITRIYDPVLGASVFESERDSVPEVIRKHRFVQPAWNNISHLIIPCQMLPLDSAGFTVYRKSCCDNPPFQLSNIAVTGFESYLNATDSVVCRNTPIQFFDSARYYLEFPIPIAPYTIDAYDYWLTPTLYPSGATRQRPTPFPKDFERLRWNFGEGGGWQTGVTDNPTYSFTKPGMYDVQLEYTDSIGCKQINSKKITVTGVSANFSISKALTNCQPTINFTDSTLMLDPCRLLNSSTPCDDVVSWSWDFGDNKPNNQSVSILKDPRKVYTSFGDFEVTLVVTTKLGCSDSIKRTISLEGPRPQFEFAADSVGCVPFTVELRNTSINPSSSAEWTWYFGDGNFKTVKHDSNVVHTYDSAGVFEVILLQNDATPLGTGKCSAIYPDTNQTGGLYRKFLVRVLPSRKTAFSLSDSILCVNDSVVFTSHSDSIYSTYKWIVGSGANDTVEISKTNGGAVYGKRYTTPGTYYIQLRPSYVPALGEPQCPTSDVKRLIVRDVEAKFLCDTLQKPFIHFKNQSRNAAKLWWNFGTGNGFESGNNMPAFPDANYNYGENRGFYTVLLAVESPEGCLDTAYCQFEYDYRVIIDAPNVFTPGDGNKLNDLFDVIVLNEEEYIINIYNRWGEKVFGADNKETQWDGKHRATGIDCPAGVYFVVINYRLRGESDKVYHGTLTLKRE